VTTDRDTLLATLLTNPTDNTARLVLADLLREADDGEQQALGRFLWAGVTAASFHEDDLIEDQLFYTAQAEIAAVASSGFPATWLGSLGLGPTPLTKRDWLWGNDRDRVTVRMGDLAGIFTRGMLSELSLTLAEWYVVASAAIAAWPLERATILDVPGLVFTITPDLPSWSLCARLNVPRRRVPLGGSVIPTAISLAPAMIEEAADWRVEEPFLNRDALAAGIGATSAELVDALRVLAGDRWPSPPRKRRGSS
jgi:uncharacterized protein (TIGR02996 family)